VSNRLACILASALATLLCAHSAFAAEWGPLEVAHQRIGVGEKQKFRLLAERSFEGSFLDMPIFAARGARPGPTLCVTAGIHGDELNSVEIARRAFATVDAKRLSGTLIVFPAVNAWGLRTSDRYLPDRRDLNRAFPGSPNGSVASIIADALFDLLTKHCERLIDLHTASDLRTNYPQIRADVSDPDTLALARQFGVGIVIDGAGPDGSLRREAQKAGIKAIIYEAGPPLVFREDEIARGTSGILNVLDGLGMFASGAKAEKSQLLKRSFWVRVPRGQGGIFLPTVALGAAVKKGDLLATVVDPLSDEVHEIRAEGDGTVVGMALPRVVLSGYGIFHIGELAAQ
jgi:predicted deacylase